MRSLLVFVIIPIFLILNISTVYPDNKKHIEIPENGTYTLNVYLQPIYEVYEKQIILNPKIIEPRKLQLIELKKNEYPIHYFTIKPNNMIILEWKSNNNRNKNMKLKDYKNFIIHSNLTNPDLKMVTFFNIDQNKDKKTDKIIYSGSDELLLEYFDKNDNKNHKILEILEKKLAFDLTTEEYRSKSFFIKLLHKLNLYKYKKWHFDALNATIKEEVSTNSFAEKSKSYDNHIFIGGFRKGGSIVFQKDISEIDPSNYTAIELKTNFDNSATKLNIRIIAKRKWTIGNKVILIKNYNTTDNNFYFLNLIDLIKEKGLEVNKIKLKEIIIDFTSSEEITTKISLKELIFYKTKEMYDIPSNFEVSTNKLIGSFNSIFNNWTSYDDDPEIINIKTILKNNSDKPQIVFISNMHLTSIESTQLPKIITSSLTNIMDPEIINNILNNENYIKLNTLYKIKDMYIKINYENITKYLNNIKPIFYEKINQFFKDQVVLSIILSSSLRNIEFYLKISGTKNSKKFEDMFSIPSINKVNVIQNINSKILYKTLKKYDNVYINDISIYLRIKNLPSPTSNFLIQINKISLEKIIITKFPKIIEADTIYINLLKDNYRIKFPVKTTFTKEDILYGGKWTSVGDIKLEKGIYKIETTQNEYFAINDLLFQIGNFIFSPDEQMKRSLPNVNKKSIRKYLIITFIIILLGFIIIAIKYLQVILKLTILLDTLMNFKTFFYLIQLILFTIIIYSTKKSHTSGNLTSSLIFLLLFYSFWVRYVIRPFLSKKWNYFKNNRSAPFFGLAIILLVFTAIILAAGNNRIAENLAIFIYFLLIEGLAIELKAFLTRRREIL